MDIRLMQKRETQKTFLSYLHDLAMLLCIVLAVFLLLIRIVVVSGPSMMDTLVDGDYLLVLGAPFYNSPQAGDVVVISKDGFKDGEPIIKRVIATEGQSVEIRSQRVYVDGVMLNEAYICTPTNAPVGDYYCAKVDKGCVFVMGDNRAVSKDSRSNDIGQIDCREILGKAVFLVFPGEDLFTNSRDFSRMGVIS